MRNYFLPHIIKYPVIRACINANATDRSRSHDRLCWNKTSYATDECEAMDDTGAENFFSQSIDFLLNFSIAVNLVSFLWTFVEEGGINIVESNALKYKLATLRERERGNI